MKPYLKLYLKTFAFIFISFLLLAFLIALLQNFSILSSSLSKLTLLVLGYIILILASFYFSMQLSSKALWHLLLFSFIYYLLSILFCLDDLHLLKQLFKPIVFLVCGIITQFSVKRE